jgi:hypothetical protein
MEPPFDPYHIAIGVSSTVVIVGLALFILDLLFNRGD